MGTFQLRAATSDNIVKAARNRILGFDVSLGPNINKTMCIITRKTILRLARLSVGAERAKLLILSASIDRGLLALAHNNQSEFSRRLAESVQFCQIAKSGTPAARKFATTALPVLEKFLLDNSAGACIIQV